MKLNLNDNIKLANLKQNPILKRQISNNSSLTQICHFVDEELNSNQSSLMKNLTEISYTKDQTVSFLNFD